MVQYSRNYDWSAIAEPKPKIGLYICFSRGTYVFWNESRRRTLKTSLDASQRVSHMWVLFSLQLYWKRYEHLKLRRLHFLYFWKKWFLFRYGTISTVPLRFVYFLLFFFKKKIDKCLDPSLFPVLWEGTGTVLSYRTILSKKNYLVFIFLKNSFFFFFFFFKF